MRTADTDTDTSTSPPDASIDVQKSLSYWASTPATPSGMLGGFESISTADVLGSRAFLAKLPLPRCDDGERVRIADCGAGIGRVTSGVLSRCRGGEVTVDLVEPVGKFLEVAKGDAGVRGCLGRVFVVGLEDWVPEGGAYWVIWNQWCLGHLPDGKLVEYFKRCREGIIPGGIITVKENIAVEPDDVYDEVDSSVTRTDMKFRALFKEAGLKIIRTEVQRGLPKQLYQVRSYALKPF